MRAALLCAFFLVVVMLAMVLGPYQDRVRGLRGEVGDLRSGRERMEREIRDLWVEENFLQDRSRVTELLELCWPDSVELEVMGWSRFQSSAGRDAGGWGCD